MRCGAALRLYASLRCSSGWPTLSSTPLRMAPRVLGHRVPALQVLVLRVLALQVPALQVLALQVLGLQVPALRVLALQVLLLAAAHLSTSSMSGRRIRRA